MKLRPDQLPGALQQSLAGLYIVAGDEPFQHGECCDLIRRAARENGFTEREVYSADTTIDWHAVSHEAASLSLFGDRKLVEIRLADKSPGREGTRVIQELAASATPDTLFLVSLYKLDMKAAWVKKAGEHGCIIQVYPVPAAQLSRWVQNRLTHHGLRASDDAVQLLCERCEGNLLSCVQEIEKLALLFEASTDKPAMINVEDVQFSVGDSSRYNIFELSTAIFSGQRARALQILDGLRGEGVALPLLLWAFLSDLRKIETAQSGGPRAFFGPNKAVLEQAVRRMPHHQILHGFRLANQIDRTIKGIEKGDPWHHFSVAVMALTSP